MRVVEAKAEDPAHLAAGEWILDLGTQLDVTRPVLFPAALERVVAFGENSAQGTLLGRTVTATGDVTNDLYVPNGLQVSADPNAGASGLTVRRRGSAGDPPSSAVFADYPVARVAGPLPAAETVSRVTEATYSWSDGRLVAEVSGIVHGAPGDARVRFSIRQPTSGLEFWLAGDGAVTGDRFSGRVVVDVRTAALEQALETGVWELRVGVHGAMSRWSSRAPLPGGPVSGATVDGLLVSVGEADGVMLVDVGATKFSPVGRVSPGAVTVRETSRGSLMTMSLDLAAAGETRHRGIVRLGNFNLPGYLVSDGSGSRVECYLSGLPGDLAMSTRFGTARVESTGVTVKVSPIGHFSFAKRTRPPRPPAWPSPSRAQRWRRRVPRQLEPLAESLASNPTARRIYRKLAGLDHEAKRSS